MLVVIAEKEELELVKKLGYENKPILITGVGGVNVIKALKNIPKDEYIINIGYAGSNNLPIGSEILVKHCHTHHPNVDFKENSYDVLSLGGDCDCYTSTDFVTNTNIEEPCVFDMELAFICALGFREIKSIKVVSDNLCIKEYRDNIDKGEKNAN